MKKYAEKKSKRWIYCSLYGLAFGTLAIIACYLVQHSLKARFNREILDKKLFDVMGNFNVKDALSNEVFLLSYSYNYAEPRFYTKTNA